MGVKVITGHRLEALFESLYERLSDQAASPMADETILVPAQGIAQWLELQLARRAGIAAGFEMPFLGTWLHQLLDAEELDRDPFEREVLTWRLWRLLDPRDAAAAPFGAASEYVEDDEDGRKRLQLCRRLSACFDDYQLYRDDLLRDFADGVEHAALSAHAPWQSELWRALLADAEAPADADDLGGCAETAHRVAALRSRLNDASWCRERLPRRLHVFGTTTIPPAFLDLLHRMGRRIDVALFVPQPTSRFVGDLRERTQQDGDHGLLARFGAQSRDFQQMLADLEERGGPEVHVQIDSLDAFESDAGPAANLLECIQRDMVTASDRGEPESPPFELQASDHSLHVHDCHSEQRELEVVRDQVCAALDADPSLTPSDVMILVPDIERYAPHAHAVFETLQDKLPLEIADRGPAIELPLCRAVMHVFGLARTRLTVSEVLQLLELPAVQRKFRIFPGDITALRHLLQAAGVRWGADGAQRARCGVPAFDANCWRQGLDRLLLGTLTGPVDDLVAGHAPIGDTTENRVDVLARFAQFVDTLFALLSEFSKDHPLDKWATLLDQLLENIFLPSENSEEEAVQHLHRAGRLLRKQAHAARHEEPVRLQVFQSWLDDTLTRNASADRRGGRGFLSGAITVAAMLPMRAVPVRVLFVCGLDDGSFPRRDAAAPFNLMTARPKTGDRSRRADDRQLFLDLLLAARERLHITFVGHSAKDNSQRAPSVVISELLEHVDRTCQSDVESPSQHVLIQHPLQPWSPRYRGTDPRLFTYAEQPAIGVGAGAPKPWCPPDTEILARPLDLERSLPLAELVTFWQNPSKTFLERVMRIRLRGQDDPDDACEPFELDGLNRFQIQDDAIKRAQRGQAPRAEALRWTRASGILPVGALGDLCFHTAQEGAATLLAEARLFAKYVVRPVDVKVGQTQITGRLDGIGAHARTRMRASKLKPSDQIAAWIEHLVLTIQADEASDDEPAWPTSTRLLATDGSHVFRPAVAAEARTHLDSLVTLYGVGMTRPLPFFERSSFAAGQAAAKGKDPAAAIADARKSFDIQQASRSYLADLNDVNIALCVRDRDPIADGPDGEFYRLAAQLWTPLLAHLEEAST